MAPRLRLLAVFAAALCCAAPAAAQAPPRRFAVVLSPARGDLALAALSFQRAGGRALTSRSLRLVVPSQTASDLIVLATPAHPRGGAREALALVANRPTSSSGPASLRLRAVAGAALGAVRVRRLEDPLTRPQTRPGWLCTAASHGRPPALRALSSHGAPISGLGAAGAVAQAFELACGLRAGTQLKAALAAPSSEPAPPVAPPPPETPKCAPCNPKPGSACPLTAVAAYCVAARDEAARSAAAGYH